MSDDLLLSAQNLTRYYHGRKVLHGVDLELKRGEVLGFLGPNGAGKSTTMKLLSGNLGAHDGVVRICGHDMADAPLLAKRHIGYLPEVPPLYLEATVDEYLKFCARLRKLNARDCVCAIAKAKRECDLEDVGSRLIGNLSKGFKQRVGIAQALLHEPAVVILDEPTNGLDPNQIRAVREMIRGLSKQHAIILSSHILSEVQTLCSRVAILHHGRIVFNADLGAPSSAISLHLGVVVDPAVLEKIAGVESAVALEDGRYLLHVDNYDRAVEAVCRSAIEHNWALQEIRRDASILENVFVELTCNDAILES
ncbi:MAG: ABC transporter ATP-binding protein [Proteobacteria bacterium]|nr:ABC transporter ATP-binding protein [Pseudomonadota bacterium]